MIRLRHKCKEICVRALLDDGFHPLYLEKDLVEELKLCPSGKEVFLQRLFGGGISPAVEHGRYTITIESLDRKYLTKQSFSINQRFIQCYLEYVMNHYLLTWLLEG
ncbi:uncharacterized protein TNCT_157641 [Trichonephila clavata]|uniref:Uncharacterized protein n=1 Tax=Trichonephila clavata TaxID=2740835 RepID=A0A8X6H9W5_TRICU|nr:uncharacterized protein TNCT_157641 [Trichonephila clavata]